MIMALLSCTATAAAAAKPAEALQVIKVNVEQLEKG
jgi:hypothetical protein